MVTGGGILLTVVCGFLIVSFGSSTGVFAWADRGGQSTGAVQTQSGSPAADVTITDASIPVDGTAGADSSDASRGDDDEDEHRDDDDREDDEHEEDERD